jgi:hypothetical protein
MKFVAVTGKDASAALFEIWDEQLRDIAPNRIALACDRLMKTWRYPNLPTPGDVRAQLEQAEEKAFELEAEREWEKLLAWVRENYFPDTGIRRGAPQLSAATTHAAHAAGRFSYIERCSQEQLVWCRKTFLAAYKNVHDTGQVEHLLSDGEAKRILARLSAPAVLTPKQLPPEPEVPLPPRAEVRKVLDRVAQIPSQEEWEARKRDLKQRANAWIAAHPEAVKQGAAQ